MILWIVISTPFVSMQQSPGIQLTKSFVLYYTMLHIISFVFLFAGIFILY